MVYENVFDFFIWFYTWINCILDMHMEKNISFNFKIAQNLILYNC